LNGAIHFVKRAKSLVDVPLVARKRRQEAAKNVKKGDVVIAGDAEHFMAAFAKAG
jgi:hypothetical protein